MLYILKKNINALILRVMLNVSVAVSSLGELREFRALLLNDQRSVGLFILFYRPRLPVPGKLILVLLIYRH